MNMSMMNKQWGEPLALLRMGECWQVREFETLNMKALNMKVQVIVTWT
jgi:hypothetical protein